MKEQDKRLSPLTILGDGALLLCALMGLTWSFLTLYAGQGLEETVPLDFCAARMDDFTLLAVVLALTTLAAWSLPRFRWAAAGGLGLLLAVFACANWDAAVHGAGLTLRGISALFAHWVSWGRTFSYEANLTPSEAGAAVRLFLSLALALLALALGWAVVRARRWWAAALLTLPPLLPGLMADLFPAWTPFMALAACWCAMLLCDLCKWAAPQSRGRLTLASLLCAAVLLGAITLAFPRQGYTRPKWALGLEARLSDAAGDFSSLLSPWEGPFRAPAAYLGDAEEADLANAGPLRYTGRTVLQVRSDYRGRMYLRGASLANYEDGVWRAMPDEAYQELPFLPQVLFFPAMRSEPLQEYTARITNAGAVGNCVYAPYFLAVQDLEEKGTSMVNDSLLARKQGQRTYSLSFVELPRPDGAPGDAVDVRFTGGQKDGANPGRYTSFVYQHYLGVPPELRGELTDLCQDLLNRLPGWTYVYSSSIDAAEQAAALLEERCVYDQSVQAPPAGTDPVHYFLFESRRGYCMHYASAAVLMLRYLGVPARYVSGFTAQTAPDREISVPDRAAHAWVEVWVDGFGWYPVEVTPDAAFDWYDQTAEEDASPSLPAEESREPEPTPTPSQETEESQSPSQGPQNPAAQDGPGSAALFLAARILAVPAGLAALLWLSQHLLKGHRARKLSSPSCNDAAIYAYICLRRMERWGGRVDTRAVELAEKARFSQHTLDTGEVRELRDMVDRERQRLCAVLGPARRLAFRFLWGSPAGRKESENGENPGKNGG